MLNSIFLRISLTTNIFLGISRQELYDVLRQNGKMSPLTKVSKNLIKNYICSRVFNPDAKALNSQILSFLSGLHKRWRACNRTHTILMSKYGTWFNNNISIIKNTNEAGGRPKKSFNECCDKTRKRKVKHLVDITPTQELITATRLSLSKSGKRDAALIVKEATDPEYRATQMKKSILNTSKDSIQINFSPTEALALLVDINLTKHQYISLRNKFKEKGLIHVLPSYDAIKKEKEKCYPQEGAIKITEKSAEIKLQPLLDLTAARLLEIQREVLENHPVANNLQFIHKWGIDGSSGQAKYKQSLSEEGISDSDLLLVSMVPIQLQTISNNENIKIIWKNPKTSSTKFCRPLGFHFKKESKESTNYEVNKIRNEIQNLKPSIVLCNGKEIIVNHKLLLTMLDGKAGSNLTDTSSQTCNICKVTPKNINNLDYIKTLSSDKNNFEYGLSSLHAHIRFFECLIHISYRLNIKKWQVRDDAEKKELQTRKNIIIQQFRREMGLLIDLPKQGAGSTNDGNTARRFFNNPEKSAEITGLDQRIIRRFAIILLVISSDFPIEVQKFQAYTNETAELYLELYGWYKMPPSVHKILIHGAQIIDSLILPIGQLAEDAQESRNKDYRFYREHFTRKNSRCNTNEDLLKRLLISSDPVISSIRPAFYKCGKNYPAEAIALFKCPEI